jgi:hypothetical protein
MPRLAYIHYLMHDARMLASTGQNAFRAVDCHASYLSSIYTDSDFCVALCHAVLRKMIWTDPNCVSCGNARHEATQKSLFV